MHWVGRDGIRPAVHGIRRIERTAEDTDSDSRDRHKQLMRNSDAPGWVLKL